MSENKISYPTIWEYRIIGVSFDEITLAVEKTLLSKSYSLEKKNTSSNKRFVSMHLSVMVSSQDERDFIFQEIKKSIGIKMIL